MQLAKTELAEARADLAAARRDLEISKAEVTAAEAQLQLRQQALERQKSLRERGIGTDAALETAALAAASARQAVLARKLAVSKAQSRIAKADTTISRRQIAFDEAKRILERTTVYAGFDGVLSGVSAVLGGLVNANEKLGSLIDPEALELSFRVSNAEFASLGQGENQLRGAPVSVRFNGLEHALSGQVERVSAAVGQGQTGRELFARLEPGAAKTLRPGDFVTVKLFEPALKQVAVIPAKAVAADGEVLLVAKDNKLQAAHVEILRKQGDLLVVRADDLAGRLLVLARAPQLGPGIRVEPHENARVGG
jgi:RND family efflux transporter MFP subunit